MNRFQSLEKLLPLMKNGKYCLIGAGPSLDLCLQEIEECLKNNFVFLISDSVAVSFLKRFPESKRIIFTVENRYHSYLKRLENENIAVYINYNERNIPRNKKNNIFGFQFVFDAPEKHKNMIRLISAGTVAGAMFSWVLYAAKILKFDNKPELTLLGTDLAYIDGMVYSKFFLSKHHDSSCFLNRETHEYLASLKKSSYAWVKHDQIIKTSEEFYQTKKNLEKIIDTINFPLNIYDYSPLGINSAKVEKKIPSSLKHF